jgi:cobalt-precorrin 5A hydrolase
MVLDPVSVVAGLGCRHGVASEAVIALLDEAISRAGLRPALLAIPDFKRAEPGLVEAARRLGLELRRVSHDALRAEQPRCVTRSERVEGAVGLRSVAEACALAAAGPQARLVLPRIAREGVTCAFAAGDSDGA